MVIYNHLQRSGLQEFGILIPIEDLRAEKTYKSLLQDNILGDLWKIWDLSFDPVEISRSDLELCHSQEYVRSLYTPELENKIIAAFELVDYAGGYHRYDPGKALSPLSDLRDWILRKAGGSVQCLYNALETGFCFYTEGGMHHGHIDYGSGFCLINDIVLAARKAQKERGLKNLWILDVDAHKGDGTAHMCQFDQSIVTLSIHMGNGWPLDCGEVLSNGAINPAFIPSDIDIPVFRGEDSAYVSKLAEGLEKLSSYPKPDAAIVVMGVDPYEKDLLPSAAGLQLTAEQMLERDMLVYDFLDSLNIPAAYLMAGGYGPHSWEVYAAFLKTVLPIRIGL
ncbi:MAG: histone deacetylase [Spirochaetia bacterium]